MRVIRYFDDEYTKEEWIQHEICKNNVQRSLVFKDDLEKICRDRNIPYKKNDTKKILLSKIIESGVTYDELVKQFHIGVNSVVYQSSLGFTKNQVKKFEKDGILKVVGQEEFLAYSKYFYASLYDIEQFYNFTEEEIQELKKRK